MAEKLATGYVELTTKGTKKAERDLDRLNRKFKQTGGFASSAGAAIAAAFSAAAVVQGVRYFVQQIEEGEAATAKLNAVLKATGNTTGFTAAELEAYSAQLQQVTRFGDEATTTATAFLATIESLGGSQLKDAIRLSQDLATVLGTDLDSAARMMGRALADPAEGLSALQRVGVKFTESQKEQIKLLVESGKAAEAQAIILAELEKRFGGAAEAAGNTLGGAFEKLSNAFGDMVQEIGAGVSGPLRDLVNIYVEEAAALGEIIKLLRERKSLTASGNDEDLKKFVEEGDVASLEAARKRAIQQARDYNASFMVQAGVARPSSEADINKIFNQANVAAQANRPAAQARKADNEQAKKDEEAAKNKKLAADDDGKSIARQIDQEIELAKLRGDNIEATRLENEKMYDAWFENIKKAKNLTKEQYEAEKKNIDSILAARMEAAKQAELQKQMKQADDEAMAMRDLRDQLQAGADANFNQMLEDRMNQRGSRMGVASLEAAIQQSLLTNKDIIPKQQLDELKNANRGLKAIDKNLEKVNQFGAGAVA